MVSRRPARRVGVGALRPNLTLDRLDTTGMAVLVFLVVGILVGRLVIDQADFENDVNTAVGDVLSHPAHEGVTLVDIRVEFAIISPGSEQSVTVVTRQSAERAYPQLADRLWQQISTATETDISVTVERIPVITDS